MKSKEHVTERFDKEIANHIMTIELDSGVNRSILFKPPTYSMWFRIVTYPGGLLFTGDMGTFCFERTDDMFKFFRGGTIRDASYCAEKCVAGKKDDFCREHAEKLCKEISDEKIGNGEWTYDEIMDEFESESGETIPGYNGLETEQDYAYWINEVTGDYPSSMRDFTYHFYWCLRAIDWAVGQYDAQRETPHDLDTMRCESCNALVSWGEARLRVSRGGHCGRCGGSLIRQARWNPILSIRIPD